MNVVTRVAALLQEKKSRKHYPHSQEYHWLLRALETYLPLPDEKKPRIFIPLIGKRHANGVVWLMLAEGSSLLSDALRESKFIDITVPIKIQQIIGGKTYTLSVNLVMSGGMPRIMGPIRKIQNPT